MIDFRSENGDLLRCLNPDFDGIAIDPRDFDMDFPRLASFLKPSV